MVIPPSHSPMRKHGHTTTLEDITQSALGICSVTVESTLMLARCLTLHYCWRVKKFSGKLLMLQSFGERPSLFL